MKPVPMVNRVDPPAGLPKAVLFDLDGTLYDQRPLRRSMLWELARAPLTKGPLAALRIARVLKSFRIRREELRALGDSEVAVGTIQYQRPADDLGISAATVETIVTEWMYEKPLRHLRAAGRPNLRAILERLRGAGLQLGCFSDYPPRAKLEALGVDDLFGVAVGATDADIHAFKPHARGFLTAAAALGVEPRDAIYVGDRHELDGAGADAAGMRSVILETGMQHVGEHGEASARSTGAHCQTIQTFAELPDALGIA